MPSESAEVKIFTLHWHSLIGLDCRAGHSGEWCCRAHDSPIFLPRIFLEAYCRIQSALPLVLASSPQRLDYEGYGLYSKVHCSVYCTRLTCKLYNNEHKSPPRAMWYFPRLAEHDILDSTLHPRHFVISPDSCPLSVTYWNRIWQSDVIWWLKLLLFGDTGSSP